METEEDGAARHGVAIQTHAVLCASSRGGTTSDASVVRVKDGKTVELVNGTDTVGVRVDHVFEQPTAQDVTERSLQHLVKACVEGVNGSVLAFGSIKSSKSECLFSRMGNRSLVDVLMESLLSGLENKVTALKNGGARTPKAPFSYTVRFSFAEIYEEVMTDLLSPSKDPKNQCVENGGLSLSAPIAEVDTFSRQVVAGARSRRKNAGLFGSATNYSSAILRIHIHQVFQFQDATPQELKSTLDIVDLPPVDRLAQSNSTSRLSEGPLLNKSLFALADCINLMVETPTSSSGYPPFNSSRLTQLLQEALGGNCLTFAFLFLVEGDYIGSKASLSVATKLPRVKNYPVVNNDVIRGLLLRNRHELLHTKSYLAGAVLSSSSGNSDYIAKILDLEAKLNHETLEKKLLKEDKDKTVSVMHELKEKYQNLFDNEIAIRKELLVCEQEKLSLSKAFVDFQMEKNAQIQDLDSEKFELETKLIQAEEMLVQIQDDDTKKATQIQDLCLKVSEVVQEKQSLGEELSLLQKKCRQLEQTLSQEAKKNQQLSLELIVLVNQKQKYQKELDDIDKKNREIKKQGDDIAGREHTIQIEVTDLKGRITNLESEIDSLRKELARRDIEIERLELSKRSAEVDFSKQSEQILSGRQAQHEDSRLKFVAQVTALSQEKKVIQVQLDRLEVDLQKTTKEKQDHVAAWMAKSQEYEELLVQNERLAHENQSQVDEFRLKLSFISKGAVDHAVDEIVQSYQRREKDLRSQLHVYQQMVNRMRRKIPSPMTHGLDGVVPTNQSDAEDNEEVKHLQERLVRSEETVSAQMEMNAKLSLAVSALEESLEKLKTENQELQLNLSSVKDHPQPHDHEYLQTTRQMQDLLLQQLDEIRKIAVQGSTNRIPSYSTNSALKDEHESADMSKLKQEKAVLEQRLATSKSEWTKIVEQVEQRCADLLTQNVILTEENQQLRQSFKKLLARLHQQR
ncbi:hypothetical protein Poli38472_011457 [Pythium oligandrum]|uniref:Kinesin motor domain-containing protein n=1 Tax=Pythium oligandrum TaxID=41045 RepID=A0A8K1FM77_PYTOL|nr:hypothetical protein Poli38472_011457 [Pythium oligandrum]|eukprot:TMW64577.1 hypothetical protein Poli38472_011457 [Pythium oligandrum]